MMRLLAMGILFFAPPVFGGDFKGNGGGAIECAGQPLEFLDFYEAKMSGLGAPQLGNTSDPEAMAQMYLAHFSKVAPKRAAQLLTGWENFYREALFLENVKLNNIDDLGVVLPVGCTWLQVVNQNHILLPPHKKYLIDQVAWSRLTAQQQVGLIFHELIYRESNAIHSRGLRILNGRIATGRLTDLSFSEKIALFNYAGLKWAEAQGFVFHLDREYFIQDDILRSAFTVESSEYVWQGQTLILRADPIEFFPNGAPKSMRIMNVLKIDFMGQSLGIKTASYEPNEKIEFFTDGRFRKGTLNEGGYWSTNYLKMYKFFEVELYPSGFPKVLGKVWGSIKIEGTFYNVLYKGRVEFSPAGQPFRFECQPYTSFTVWGQKAWARGGSIVELTPQLEFAEFEAAKDGQLRHPSGHWLKFSAGERVRVAP